MQSGEPLPFLENRMSEISNNSDVIDSRDIIKRIEELEALETPDEEEQDELTALRDVAEQAKGYADDWRHGATLIRDSYFEDYAREFADDIGAIDNESKWPNSCIDWAKAADELKQDYTSIDFDGVDYWIR